MTPFQRSRLTGRQAQVWAAAYSNAFVRGFDLVHTHRGFDHASDVDHAEEALTIADLAVYQMRRWERENEGWG